MATGSHSQALGVITGSVTTTFFAEILDIKPSGVARDWIDATSMAITGTTTGGYGNKVGFASYYVNPGKVTVKLNYNPDTVPPMHLAAETWTIKLGNSTTQATLAGSGQFTSWDIDAPLDGQAMTATAVINFTSKVTVTAGT